MTHGAAAIPAVPAASRATPAELRLLQAGVGAVWLWTGVAVLHPYYRQVGAAYLAPLGLPDAIMWATCAAEVALGLAVALGRPATWLAALQVGMVASFTLILGALEPLLLAHPFGVLSKNVALVAAVGGAWLLAREGWTPRATWLLRGGMAAIWITEGLFPKLLFLQPFEVAVVAGSGLVPIDPSVFLRLLGVAQVASGIAALLLSGRALRVLLACQLGALVLLPLLVAAQDPMLWVHPFGPLSKNVPILAGTWVVLRRCSSWS